ncbi:MAG: glycosyltransferase family 4 protein [Desulfobacteraceae bacterium]|nr:glycosyltransferase family 4 protein [Desulfobacteraceae bacterium]MBC2757250.1 glycosyltransferase family 4 protein [Desulfobacteraceae bacterium]
MNILLLNYEFPPIGGGAGKATYNLARELARLGHKVDVLTSKLKSQLDQENLDGFTVYRVMSWRKGIHDCGFRGALTYVLFAIFKFLQLTRKNQYDVTHYFFGLPTGFLSLLPGPQNKTPYFISLRGSDVPGYDKYNKSLEKVHRILAPLTRKIWRNAEQIIVVTNSLKQTALLTAPSQKFHVIPNGVESKFLKVLPSTNKKSNGLKLISVARLIERKGIHYILNALADLQDPDISLLIVGTGNFETQLKKICKDLSLEGVVTFYGFCNPQVLPELYAKYDVFILPSLAEAFGNVFAEAMACGLPVIGTNIGGIPDLVGKENGILTRPGDIDQIKHAIVRLKKSEMLRTQMQLANRKKIIEQYSWKRVANQYITIYQGENDI